LRCGKERSSAYLGPNGAGKTTLAKLLTRLYDPTWGQILLDGVDLREYDLTSLRQRIGVIFQDFVYMLLTVVALTCITAGYLAYCCFFSYTISL